MSVLLNVLNDLMKTNDEIKKSVANTDMEAVTLSMMIRVPI